MTNPLVGTWRLVSQEVRWTDGRVEHPFGEDPFGYLIYTSEGFMSVALMSRSRPHVINVPVLRAATPEEKAVAAETFLGYSGKYTVLDDRVTHHIEVSLFQNEVGRDEVRQILLSGDTLTLSGMLRHTEQGDFSPHLTWQRVAAGSLP